MFPVHPELVRLISDWYVTTLIKTPGHAPTPSKPVPIPSEVPVLDMLDQPEGTAKVAAKLQQARQHDPKATLFDEPIVNFIGYEHLQAGDTAGAIEILKLNAEAFPNSPNVYDSLGDVYLAAGQKDLARQNARRALELLPSDTSDPEERRKAIHDNAEKKLQETGGTPQK